jgi:hypothetical protein
LKISQGHIFAFQFLEYFGKMIAPLVTVLRNRAPDGISSLRIWSPSPSLVASGPLT